MGETLQHIKSIYSSIKKYYQRQFYQDQYRKLKSYDNLLKQYGQLTINVQLKYKFDNVLNIAPLILENMDNQLHKIDIINYQIILENVKLRRYQLKISKSMKYWLLKQKYIKIEFIQIAFFIQMRLQSTINIRKKQSFLLKLIFLTAHISENTIIFITMKQQTRIETELPDNLSQDQLIDNYEKRTKQQLFMEKQEPINSTNNTINQTNNTDEKYGRFYMQNFEKNQQESNLDNFQWKFSNQKEEISIKRQQIADEVIDKQKEKQIKPRRVRRKRMQINQKGLAKVVKLFELYEQSQNGQFKGKKKITMQKISQMTGYCMNTIALLYREYQFDKTLTNRFIKIRTKNNSQSSQLTQKRIQSIKKILQENPFRTQGEIAILMNQDDSLKIKGKPIVNKSISRLLKMMKYSKKKVVRVPQFRNTPQNIERRYQYCTYYKLIHQKKCKIYYLDESAFNLFTMRDTAWSKVQEPVHHKIQFPKGKNTSIIAIISLKGVLQYEIKQGNFRLQHHLNFIERFFARRASKKNDQPLQKEYLIMDNCRIHDRTRTNILSERSGNIEVLFLPPYSPQLNPIQNWFHELKSKVRASLFKNNDELIVSIKQTIQIYKQHDFSNYYRDALKHVERGLRRQQF